MAKTYEDYYKDTYQQARDEVERQYGTRKKSDQTLIDQIGDSIDRQANAASQGYQSRIDNAQQEYQPLYDRNALQELVTRRQVEESMANLGMTDSGLNRTQQTAIGLQRGNADAQVRRDQQAYVQQAQQAIDQIMAEAASQKMQNESSIRQATENWYTGALASAQQAASSSAAARYQAEKEYQAQIEAAQIKAAQTAARDLTSARAKYAQSLISSGKSEDEAWASAYARYGADSKEETKYYQAYNAALNAGYSAGAARAYAQAGGGADGEDAVQAYHIANAQSVVGSNDLLKDGKGGFEIVAALFKGGKDNAKYTVEKLASVVPKMNGYENLTDSEKTIALAIASGNVIRSRWGNESAEFKKKLAEGLREKFTGLALDAALTAAGVN